MRSIRISERITKRDNNSFKQYLNEIDGIDMFTPEEEVECAKRAYNGDRDAINEMVRRNLRFVVSVAKQYESANAPLEDLVNEGNIGLVMAAEKYNGSTGFKFITYAVFWIRKLILEYIAKNGRLVRLPANKINNLSKMNQQITELEQKHGRGVHLPELIDELGSIMSIDEIKELETISNTKFDSLDELIGDGDNKFSLYEIISDDACKPSDHLLHESDFKKRLNKTLNKLKPRDKEIMVLLFGLDGSAPLTLKEVGEHVGLTREMVRQIREKTLKLLKKAYTD